MAPIAIAPADYQAFEQVLVAIQAAWSAHDLNRMSALLTPEQKLVLEHKLASRINSDGVLQVRSQVHRTQLGNKAEVVRKMHALLEASLKRKKPRIATRPTAAAKERRIEEIGSGCSRVWRRGNMEDNVQISPCIEDAGCWRG